MVALLAVALAAALVALAGLVARDRARRRDLRALAELLDRAGDAPAARARLTSADPAVQALARAVDRHLEADAVAASARRSADERLREQLSALSHDLRTPLAGALGYLQLADRAEDAPAAARYLDGARGRLGDLRALTDDLFVYARASDPSFSPELVPCDLGAVVGEALAARYGALSARGWEPEVELDESAPPVLADPDALARVVANLLDNALAHGSGAPRVRVAGAELVVENPVDAAAAARLDVARLTERFYQGDPSRAGGGTGLGLAVARALAESMGGSLEVAVLLDPPTFSAVVRLAVAPFSENVSFPHISDRGAGS